ncbi:MAG: ATP-binding protein, partial [Erysipelotrichaceae bacterium]|nr:ATP-binding protein [Erysipelotrichaceae bacterium]
MKLFDCSSVFTQDKRIFIISGHYGSGKTEFAVNYVLKLREALPDKKIALVDLDLINPYFRSRERRSILEAKGIKVYGGSTYDDLLADIQSYNAAIVGPLQDEEVYTVIDAGGNFAGARPLKQFMPYFKEDITELCVVINANRYETQTVDQCMEQITSIEEETGLKVTGVINNTHMLRETEMYHIEKGIKLAEEVAEVS